MKNQNNKLYEEVLDKIINQQLNKFEAKNKLAEILDTYFVSTIESDPEKYDINLIINNYLRDKKLQNLSEGTTNNYKRVLQHFSNYMNKRVQEVEKQDIINYFEYYKQINPNIMASSLETIRSDIRAFFVWMKDENIITENPMLKIKPFKTDKVLRKPLSIRELEILRYNCDDLRLRAMMETFYASGCRLSELSQINKDDIDWQNERLIIRGKGNKDRYIFLTSRAVIHLQKYIESRHDSCEALFVTIKKPYRRLGKRAIEKEIHKLGIEAGFNDSVFCHRFRHTTASLLVSNGAPLPVVQEIMGHSTISTTMEYTHITPEFKQQNYKRYMNQ